jgi:hypothetical protein
MMYGKILIMGKRGFNSLRYAGWAVALLALSSPARTARADFYLASWQNIREEARWLKLDAALNFYSTAHNFRNEGNVDNPPGLTRYTRIQTDLLAAYGMTDRLTLFARASWARVDVNSVAMSGTAYGFTDQTIGGNIRLHEQDVPEDYLPSSLDLQLQIDIPTYSNARARSNGLPFLGDGSIDVTTGLFWTQPLLSGKDALITVTGGAGYTYRNAYFSSAFPYSLVFKLRPRKRGFVVTAGMNGMASLQNDGQPGASATLGGDSTGTGGSFITNAVNPSVTRFRGDLGWQFSPKTILAAGVDSAAFGANSPAGTNIVLGLQIRIPGSGIEDAEPASREDVLSPDDGRNLKHPAALRKSEHPDKGFVSYTLEARVVRVNDRLNLVKIDKGTKDRVSVGEVFDIFSTQPDGEVKDVIARARVTAVAEEESALEVTEYFRESWINEQFVAKRVVQ